MAPAGILRLPTPLLLLSSTPNQESSSSLHPVPPSPCPLSLKFPLLPSSFLQLLAIPQPSPSTAESGPPSLPLPPSGTIAPPAVTNQLLMLSFEWWLFLSPTSEPQGWNLCSHCSLFLSSTEDSVVPPHLPALSPSTSFSSLSTAFPKHLAPVHTHPLHRCPPSCEVSSSTGTILSGTGLTHPPTPVTSTPLCHTLDIFFF